METDRRQAYFCPNKVLAPLDRFMKQQWLGSRRFTHRPLNTTDVQSDNAPAAMRPPTIKVLSILWHL